MTCTHSITCVAPCGPVFICAPDAPDKVRCRDGRHVWVSWHPTLGPEVTHDRAGNRLHEAWYDDPPVAEAVDWWYLRGRKG